MDTDINDTLRGDKAAPRETIGQQLRELQHNARPHPATPRRSGQRNEAYHQRMGTRQQRTQSPDKKDARRSVPPISRRTRQPVRLHIYRICPTRKPIGSDLPTQATLRPPGFGPQPKASSPGCPASTVTPSAWRSTVPRFRRSTLSSNSPRFITSHSVGSWRTTTTTSHTSPSDAATTRPRD